jgi:pyruvate,water dikinase
MWRLSRQIRNSPVLLDMFRQRLPGAAAAELERSDDGRALLTALRTHLEDYGWRSDALMELAGRTWREDLTVPLNALYGLAALDDAEDPEARLHRLASRRERLLADARSRLSSDAAALARFERLYMQARSHVILDEDHNFYIDQMGTTALRLPILEMGRRLVGRNAIEDRDDVFMLNTTEIRDGLAGRDYRGMVAVRRREMAYWASIAPPPSIGTPPSDEAIDPFIAALMKLDAPPAPQAQSATVIHGTPASPGATRGRAKVARSLEEASTAEPGQVLVCEMTLPPWSVLFPAFGAVVADTGGVLSHCATVARECGIPCVVGTVVGTATIQDGMLLEVDGSKGEVRIVGLPD